MAGKTNEFREAELLLVSRIQENDGNHRKDMDEAEIKELADSIDQVGLIQPIVVRALKTKKYDYKVVAGSRRLAAFQLLKADHIPATIMKGTEADYEMVQIIENCQRKDVTPVEEFHAFMSLYNRKFSAEDIAAQIGKSVQYVYDRMNITRLCDEAVVALHKNILHISQARELMKVPKEIQSDILKVMAIKSGDEVIDFKPAKDFKQQVFSSYQQDLKNAIFDIAKEDLVPNVPACKDCPFRSHNKTLFFQDYQDDCFNTGCYRKKTIAELGLREKALQGDKFEVVRITQLGWTEEDQEEGYIFYSGVREVPESEVKGGYKVKRMALVFNGTQVGYSYPVYTEAELTEIDKRKSKERDDKSEESDAIRTTKTVVMEKLIFQITEKTASNVKTENTNLVKKVVAHQLWNEANVDDLKQVCKRLKWDAKVENEKVTYKNIDYSNYLEFYEQNIRKIKPEQLTELVNWLALSYCTRGDFNSIIVQEAQASKIDVKKVLDDANKLNKTEVVVNDLTE